MTKLIENILESKIVYDGSMKKIILELMEFNKEDHKNNCSDNVQSINHNLTRNTYILKSFSEILHPKCFKTEFIGIIPKLKNQFSKLEPVLKSVIFDNYRSSTTEIISPKFTDQNSKLASLIHELYNLALF